MGALDGIEQAGADAVAEIEEAVGGPLYPIHEYVEPVPVGGDGRYFRCSWRSPQVLAWLRERGVTDVLNLCVERANDDDVRAAGFVPWNLPIHDGDVPSEEQIRWFDLLAAPRLAFGCEAGVGRTGCVAAYLLVSRYGWTAEQALVDAQRHGTLMPRQIEWIRRLAA